MYCFDNLSDLLFFGNFNTDNCQSLEINVWPCKLGKNVSLCRIYSIHGLTCILSKTRRSIIKICMMIIRLLYQKVSQFFIESLLLNHFKRLTWSKEMQCRHWMFNLNVIPYFDTFYRSGSPLSNFDGAITKIIFEVSLDSRIEKRVIYGIL